MLELFTKSVNVKSQEENILVALVQRLSIVGPCDTVVICMSFFVQNLHIIIGK
jgi:hypothetical protein